MPIRTITIGSGAWTNEFKRALTAQYQALALQAPDTVTGLQGEQVRPELLVYFAEQPPAAGALPDTALAAYAAAARHLLPVVEDAPSVVTHLPEELGRFNAFFKARHGPRWPDALVDEVLSLAWQRRRIRKVFISYRRVDSEAVAHQLYGRYAERGFEVFLDDATIQRGDDFQRELRWWLNDADAVLLLVSPHLGDSAWVREEIELAKTWRIGLLGVVWPPGTLTKGGAEERTVDRIPNHLRAQLETNSFESTLAGTEASKQQLSEHELDKVDELLFTGRAQAVASRVRDLLDLARDKLETLFTIHAARPDGDLDLTAKDGTGNWSACIVPFRPNTAEIFAHWETCRARNGLVGTLMIYPELYPNDERARALKVITDAWGAAASPRFELWTVHT